MIHTTKKRHDRGARVSSRGASEALPFLFLAFSGFLLALPSKHGLLLHRFSQGLLEPKNDERVSILKYFFVGGGEEGKSEKYMHDQMMP